MSPRRERLLIALTAAAGACAVIAAYRPGLMSPDPIGQLREARSGAVSNQHSVLMTTLLGLFDSIHPGPLLMLVFQNLLFWGALALLAHVCIRRTGRACAMVAVVGVSPAVFALLGTIWKDVLLGASLLAAVAATAAYERLGRKAFAWGAAVALVMAICMRPNGVFAAIPIAAYLFWRLSSARIARTAAGVLGVVAAAFCINAALTRVQAFPFAFSLGFYDLSAISLRTGRLAWPEPYRSRLIAERGSEEGALEELSRHFNVDAPFDFFLFDVANGVGVDEAALPPGRRPVLPLVFTRDPAKVAGVRDAWVREIVSRPGDYAAHRLSVFGSLLGIGRANVCYPFTNVTNWNNLGLYFDPNPFGRFVLDRLDSLRNTAWFRGWLYLLPCLAFAAAGLWPGRKGRRAFGGLPLAVSLSALFYAAPYLLLTVTCEFRYLWWCVLAAWITPVLALGPGASPKARATARGASAAR